MKLIVGEWKELGSMRIVPIQKVGACTMSIALDMSIVGASKRGRSVEPGSSSEHPHSKKRRVQSQSRLM